LRTRYQRSGRNGCVRLAQPMECAACGHIQPSLSLVIFAISLISCSRSKEAVTPEPVVVADQWKESQDRSPIDDTVTYSLRLTAEGSVDVRPVLIIPCSSRKLSVYVNTRTVLSKESLYDDLGWYSRGRYRLTEKSPKKFLGIPPKTITLSLRQRKQWTGTTYATSSRQNL
jgi:hypothetical protein